MTWKQERSNACPCRHKGLGRLSKQEPFFPFCCQETTFADIFLAFVKTELHFLLRAIKSTVTSSI